MTDRHDAEQHARATLRLMSTLDPSTVEELLRGALEALPINDGRSHPQLHKLARAFARHGAALSSRTLEELLRALLRRWAQLPPEATNALALALGEHVSDLPDATLDLLDEAGGDEMHERQQQPPGAGVFSPPPLLEALRQAMLEGPVPTLARRWSPGLIYMRNGEVVHVDAADPFYDRLLGVAVPEPEGDAE